MNTPDCGSRAVASPPRKPAVPKTAGAIQRRRRDAVPTRQPSRTEISTIIVTRNGLSEVPSESMPARTSGSGQAVDEDVAHRGDRRGDLARQSGGQLGQPQGQGRTERPGDARAPADVDVVDHRPTTLGVCWEFPAERSH